MRKLKLQVQITIDGLIAGPKGEMDFMTWNWDDGLKDYVGELTKPVDCIILGRKLAEGFIPYWNEVAKDPNNPEAEAGKKFSDTRKLVFTQTLESCPWENAVLAKADLREEIARLKQEDGKDIIAYGGATFVSSLIRENLIDDYHLLVNPSAIGNGMPIFRQLTESRNFKLVKATPFSCGIVALNYAPSL